MPIACHEAADRVKTKRSTIRQWFGSSGKAIVVDQDSRLEILQDIIRRSWSVAQTGGYLCVCVHVQKPGSWQPSARARRSLSDLRFSGSDVHESVCGRPSPASSASMAFVAPNLVRNTERSAPLSSAMFFRGRPFRPERLQESDPTLTQVFSRFAVDGVLRAASLPELLGHIGLTFSKATQVQQRGRSSQSSEATARG